MSSDQPGATPAQQQHAERLLEAHAARRPIAPLTEQDPQLTLADAYAIQSAVIDAQVRDGARVVGRKVGLTSKPMQEMLGVDEPDFGVLLDGMAVEDGGVVALDRLLQPRAEAEIAFLMQADVEGPNATAASVIPAIAGALPAIEIIDSRVADWKIRLVDTVADNASSGMFVLGAQLTPLAGLDLRLEGMALWQDDRLVDTGAGAAVLGNPLHCVAWLANTLSAYGTGLRAGDVVLAGALHRAIPIRGDEVLRAEFTRLGAVSVRFTTASGDAS
jgi:2-keto-4-pentenoate hydratase